VVNSPSTLKTPRYATVDPAPIASHVKRMDNHAREPWRE
jgi:hypothetical protein